MHSLFKRIRTFAGVIEETSSNMVIITLLNHAQMWDRHIRWHTAVVPGSISQVSGIFQQIHNDIDMLEIFMYVIYLILTAMFISKWFQPIHGVLAASWMHEKQFHNVVLTRCCSGHCIMCLSIWYLYLCISVLGLMFARNSWHGYGACNVVGFLRDLEAMW